MPKCGRHCGFVPQATFVEQWRKVLSSGVVDSGTRVELLRQLAARDGGVSITCAGRSMEPTIMMGQQVTVSSARAPAVGEIALFVTNAGATVLHRLVARVPLTRRWLHLGDNQTGGDAGVIDEGCIIGCALGNYAATPTSKFHDGRRIAARLLRGAVTAAKQKLRSR